MKKPKPQKKPSTPVEAPSPKCITCKKKVSQSAYCAGCYSYICDDCNEHEREENYHQPALHAAA